MKVGTLEIDLRADVARLAADMAEAKKSVTGAMKEVEAAVGMAKAALIGLTGIGSAMAFKGIIESAIEGKARLYDMSVQTGISVEALSGMGTVAKYSGTELASVASASNKLSKALYTQNEDSKGAAQALKALGINFEQFKALQPDEQMRQIALRMDQFNDGAGKAAVSMLLFGKSGAELLPFLKEWAERQDIVGKQTTESALKAKEYEDNLVTLKRAGDEWKKQLAEELLPALVDITNQLIDGKAAYGSWAAAIFDLGTLNPFNTANENLDATREKLAKYRADLQEMKARENSGSYIDMFNSIGSGRQMAKIEDQIKLLEKREQYLLKQSERGIGEGGVNLFAEPKKTLDVPGTGGGADKVRDDYTPLIRVIAEKTQAQQMELDGSAKLTDGQKMLSKVLTDLAGGYIKLTQAQAAKVVGDLQGVIALEDLNKAREAEIKWLQQSGQENDRYRAAMEQQRKTLEQQAADLEDQVVLYGRTSLQLQRLEEARLRDSAAALRQKAAQADAAFLDDIAESYRAQADAIERTATARGRLTDRMQRDRTDPLAGADRAVKEYLDDVQRAGDATYGAVRNSMGLLEDTLTDFFSKGKLDARSFIDAMISEFVRLRVVKPMLSNLFGSDGFGGLMGVIFGGGGSLAGATGFGDYNATAAIAGMRAAGGPVDGGRSYIVGERGPELFTPSSAGSITPNSALGRGGPQITISPTIHIDSRADAQQVRALVAQGVAEGARQQMEALRAQGVV